MEFVPGDVARLKSGGPSMTVENVGQAAMTQEDTVWCVWFEKVGNKQIAQRETFAPVTLEKKERKVGQQRLVRT
ncbi:YodC family protein [Hwanghaeella sp.]|uniref:YodC family protein n=1 Tax=Hwanghaeella sp. TaxID=2605943 RepID=UPI003CCC11C0